MHQIQLTQLILILCKWNRSSGVHSFGPTWKTKDNFIPANHSVMKSICQVMIPSNCTDLQMSYYEHAWNSGKVPSANM